MCEESAVADLGPEYYEVARYVFPVMRYVSFDTDIKRRRAFDVTTTSRERERMGEAMEFALVKSLDDPVDFEADRVFKFVVCMATLRASREGMRGIMQRAQQILATDGVAVFLVALAGNREKETGERWKELGGDKVSRFRRSTLIDVAQRLGLKGTVALPSRDLYGRGYALLVLRR